MGLIQSKTNYELILVTTVFIGLSKNFKILAKKTNNIKDF